MGQQYRPQLPSTDGSFILPDIELDRDLTPEINFLSELGLDKTNLAMNILYHRLESGENNGLDSFLEDLGNCMDNFDFYPEDTPLEKQNELFSRIGDSAQLIYEEVCTALKPAIDIIETNFHNAKRVFDAFIDMDRPDGVGPVIVSIREMT